MLPSEGNRRVVAHCGSGAHRPMPVAPAPRREQPGGAGERAAALAEQRALHRRIRENLLKKGTYEIKKCEEARMCDRLPRDLPCDYCESFSKPMLEFRYSWIGTTPDGRPYDDRDDVWLHNDKADAPEAKDAYWLGLAGVDYNDTAAIVAYVSGEQYDPPVGHAPAPWVPRADAVPNAIGAWANHGPPAGHVAPVMPAEDDPHAEIVIRFLYPDGRPFKRRDGGPLPSIVIRSDMVAAMRMAYRNGSCGKGKTMSNLLNLHRFADFAKKDDMAKRIRPVISRALRGPVFGEEAQPAPAAQQPQPVVQPPQAVVPPPVDEPVGEAEPQVEQLVGGAPAFDHARRQP
ncbi:hypothetical protein AAVH_15415 [Aphelenchoides avenae]|nr:hypothetical protein AAVH_15415 [Aphelenchus avenae]